MQIALSPAERAFLDTTRRAVLATIGSDGRPRLVPVCFVVAPNDAFGGSLIYTPVDEKPKRDADPHKLARVRDLLARPAVTLLADRWDEDWSRLAWLRLYGTAELLEPVTDGHAEEHGSAITLLREKYQQYRDHDLEALPVLRIVVTRAVSWGDLATTTPG